MAEIRYVQPEDKEFWYSLDKHLSEQEFHNKIINQAARKVLKPYGLFQKVNSPVKSGTKEDTFF